jgi:hypothetical protein
MPANTISTRRHAFFVSTLRHLRTMAKRPSTTIVLGIGVCICGLAEMLEDVLVEFDSKVNAYHGVVLFGGITMFRGLIELLEGLELVGLELEDEPVDTPTSKPARDD